MSHKDWHTSQSPQREGLLHIASGISSFAAALESNFVGLIPGHSLRFWALAVAHIVHVLGPPHFAKSLTLVGHSV